MIVAENQPSTQAPPHLRLSGVGMIVAENQPSTQAPPLFVPTGPRELRRVSQKISPQRRRRRCPRTPLVQSLDVCRRRSALNAGAAAVVLRNRIHEVMQSPKISPQRRRRRRWSRRGIIPPCRCRRRSALNAGAAASHRRGSLQNRRWTSPKISPQRRRRRILSTLRPLAIDMSPKISPQRRRRRVQTAGFLTRLGCGRRRSALNAGAAAGRS